MSRMAWRLAVASLLAALPALAGCVQSPPAEITSSPLALPAVKSPTAVDYPLAEAVEHERRAGELDAQARRLDERIGDLTVQEHELLDRLTALRNDTYQLPVEREARYTLLVSNLGRVRQEIAVARQLRGEFESGRGKELNKAVLSRQRAEALLAGRVPDASH